MLAIPDLSPKTIGLLELSRNHAEDLLVLQEYNDADRTIKRLIKAIVPKVYFRTLWKHHMGYAIVRSLYKLTHLHANYGMLKYEHIQAIDMELKTPIKRETYLEAFVSHIEDNQESVASKNPYTNKKIISITYNLVFKVSFYYIECK